MQLKHLVINGFKSFADKTEIDFVPGLTGIVGPNGSGKSNITEAIRWTLGEQSAKSLRGEKMGDVIFAGTATRPPLNRAEVTMTFDNSDGYLKDQPASVSVTRRLYRDGESDFLINKQPVRLKDIIDLFMDSGLGKESFSFISQGRVESIFNSKPEERRGILEEAAGVLKYKQQKQKAQHELQDTDDNLARVHDIVAELQHQVTPLEEQASLARDFERQTADYQRIHKQILALEIGQLATEQETTQTQATETKKQVEALTQKVKALEQRSETLTATDQDMDARLTKLNDELLTKSMKVENLTGEVNLSSERASNAQDTLKDLQDQLTAAKDQLTTANEKSATLQTQLATQKKQRRELEAQLQTQTERAHTPEQLNAQLEQAQNHYIALLQKQADNKNALASVQKDQQIAENQQSARTSRLHELQKRVEQAQAAKAAGEARLTEVTEALAAVQTSQQEARQIAAGDNNAYEQANQAFQHAVNDYQRAKARFETLQELKDDYAGFYAGVRAVLKHKAQLPGVIGAVAELLQVPTEYEQAFDIALGANLQAVVTEDEAAAKQAINYLKAQRAGRATFLPVSVIRPRQLPQALKTRLSQQVGFIGVGVELVQFDAHLQPVMANLMGSLLVADNLDHGIQIANATQHRYRIVTLGGDILNPGGALTGGQVKTRASSPLARTQEVTQLKQRLTDMNHSLQKQQAALKTLMNKANLSRQAADETSAKVAAQQAALTAQTGQQKTQAETTTQLERQLKAMQLSMAGEEDFEAKTSALTDEGASIAAQLTEAQHKIADTKEALTAASDEEADYQAQLTALQTKLAVLKNQQQTTKTQLEQWQDNAVSADNAVHSLSKRIETITHGAQDSAHEKATRKATIANLNREIETLKVEQDKLTKEKAANRGTLSDVSAQITTTYTQQHQAMTAAEQQAVDLNRIKLSLDSRLNTLAESYQLTYEAAAKGLSVKAEELPTLKSKLKLLKRGLDDLGPVNPNAIAEYDSVKERYEFLTKQQDDLVKAKDQLAATMAELDEEVKTRFKDMFDETNKAFQEIFPRMFGGGHAHLSLTDPTDLLNTGLEISAQPPGKKLQRLSLLSGGERALTAIVLLFAILQVRPVPFSILDEVEASLDDVNVNRFGEFLKHYASDTQFIVITHRRGTMLAANMLYGVTMQESGVSKMMAVSLDDVREAEAK